jgi:hypothetical protein
MITEIALENFVQDITNIYYYIYLPHHEMATQSGKVYMHRYVMAKHLNRLLTPEEVVHHKDEDRTNNDINNLQLMDAVEHAKHHVQLVERIEVICTNCGCVFERTEKRIKRSPSGNMFCSRKCNSTYVRDFDVDAEVLQDLVWSMPTVKVAEMFSVSDVAVGKRCKVLGVTKPPRGYWRKVQTGTLGKEPKVRGESCFKLTKEQAEYILANFIAKHKKFGARALGRMFNVGHNAIMAVVNGTRGSRYAD